jgi:hypothetical protein
MVIGYEVSDDTGHTYVLGLYDIVTKSGKDTFHVFMNVLYDIDDRLTSTSDNTAKIIRNTISDLAATEHKYNKLVDVYGKDILP